MTATFKRVNASVFYVDEHGKTQSVKVKTIVPASQEGFFSIEIEPGEKWKENTIWNLLDMELSMMGLDLNHSLPLVSAIKEIITGKITEIAWAKTEIKMQEECLIKIRRHWFYRLGRNLGLDL